MKTNKISIIGAGNVGAATAFALMMNKVASDIVMYDIDHKKAEGEALDIFQGTSLVAPVDVVAGSIEDTKDSDIVVITAGAAQKPGETRLDLVNKNIAIYQKLIPEIVKYNPHTILLVVSNPVDILTYVTWKISGFPSERVIGSGTVLDTSRFKSAIGRAFDIDARNVHGYIIGEHGDSEIAVYSKTTIGVITFDEYFKSQKIKEKGFKTRIAAEVKNAAYEIIQRKGYTNYAVAVAVARICTAILRDERSILTTSSYLTGEYHVDDVYISTPTVIGRSGVAKILEFDLDADEQIAFEESANIIKGILKASTLEK
ncbi:L-lactate dehydrogenase [Acholeplasma equirhinis]|uniref:L-lactate dehydrogenase n=1 Tax=Acholeplasma equirhinis TaxID=555393 RepID=UPI00197AFAE3|nr:L-lactate dehydrogenase [Acholeplasma equirhinis]MBN3490284.1 L-lactate dehydrogenase [Acholeplasma equirhinis]